MIDFREMNRGRTVEESSQATRPAKANKTTEATSNLDILARLVLRSVSSKREQSGLVVPFAPVLGSTAALQFFSPSPAHITRP
jgi:hypothetical protein